MRMRGVRVLAFMQIHPLAGWGRIDCGIRKIPSFCRLYVVAGMVLRKDIIGRKMNRSHTSRF